jgi:hypothetical protein
VTSPERSVWREWKLNCEFYNAIAKKDIAKHLVHIEYNVGSSYVLCGFNVWKSVELNAAVRVESEQEIGILE